MSLCATCGESRCEHRDDQWDRAADRAYTEAGIMPVDEYVRRYGNHAPASDRGCVA